VEGKSSKYCGISEVQMVAFLEIEQKFLVSQLETDLLPNFCDCSVECGGYEEIKNPFELFIMFNPFQ